MKKGFVHCDLKPANILLVKDDEKDDDFVAKIADFGLTKRTRRLYFAPECVLVNYQEQPSDIWALGCIVLSELNHKIKFESPIIPRDHSISKEAKDFLMKCF